MHATVLSVSTNPRHALAKEPCASITLLAGRGVEGDAHSGATVQHRSRKRWNPELPNLRQVHLLAAETLEDLGDRGFAVAPGQAGENVTTRGIDLHALPVATTIALGDEAVVELTGLRNPCVQLDRFRDGLMAAVLGRDESGGLVRRAGVMAVVLAGGEVRPGDAIVVTVPARRHIPLAPV